MGCTSDPGSDCNDENEKPAHKVTLSDFYIGKYEVTQAQWEAVMGNNPSDFRDCKTCPIEVVSWEDVQEFIKKLNTKTGLNYRLPTEAEWEYAARGGTQSKGYKYSGSNNADEVAWYLDDLERKTHPVGTKKANELGIYDMSGNVWEWCSDWYGAYNSEAQTNPKGSAEGEVPLRIIRGGGWDYDVQGVRVSYRFYGMQGESSENSLGFRLARSTE
jgi:formylglycine-generating enzyme required for sulfatase activity